MKKALLIIIVLGCMPYAFGRADFVLASDTLENHHVIFRQEDVNGHHYVIFITGINSSASSNDSEPIGGKFKIIVEELRRHGLSKFVYFSYSAAFFGEDDYCKGWGANGCAEDGSGSLSSLYLYPEYLEVHTKFSIRLQEKVLEWLIREIELQDSDAKISLVGFSLGGVVSSYWASQTNEKEHKESIHEIVLINSPVGGIPIARAVLDGCDDVVFPETVGCNALRNILMDNYGPVVLKQVQLPYGNEKESLVDNMYNATQKNFSMTSIQSTDDYNVNDEPFPLCIGTIGWLCPIVEQVPIGIGSQGWPEINNIHHMSLGGVGKPSKPLSFPFLILILDRNHSATVEHEQTAILVRKAIVRPSSDEANNVKYDARGSGFIYDIVIAGETANLEFQVTNAGLLAWEGTQIEAEPVPGSDFDYLETHHLADIIPPGQRASWTVSIPNVSGGTIKTVEYQMTQNGEQFGEVIPGYIFVLPEELKDLEGQLQQKIDEWIAKGEQELQNLIDTIIQEIQNAIEEQAQEAVNDLLSKCKSTFGLIITGVVYVYFKRTKPYDWI